MTIERDPAILELFNVAEEDLTGEKFVALTMSRVDHLRRRSLAGWILVGLVLLAVGWLLAAPIQGAIQLLTQSLSISLVDLGDRWIARMISPATSVAGVVAFILLGLLAAYRKIFS